MLVSPPFCDRDIAPGDQGCEQVDPLAPALFALGQHAVLCQASSALHSSQRLLAFLDDVYVLAVREGCGIASSEGKTRVTIRRRAATRNRRAGR